MSAMLSSKPATQGRRVLQASAALSRRAVLCAFAVCGMGALAAPTDAHAASEAEAFVRTNIDKSYEILNRGGPNRLVEFRTQLLAMVDAKRVAMFTLGQYARDASQSDLERFVASFTDLLTGVYLRGLDTYRGQSLDVTGSMERAPGDVIVNVVAGNRDNPGSRVHLDFRVRRQAESKMVVTDLQVEGVWLAITQREQFTAYLQQHHGDIASLSSDIEKRATQLAAASD
jgi:phospholipid transport system substrate-binding protein